MWAKIDYQVPDIISSTDVPEEIVIKHIKEKIAFQLGLYIIENCDWITNDDIIPGKNIEKDFVFFPDAARFSRVLLSNGCQHLLDPNFK